MTCRRQNILMSRLTAAGAVNLAQGRKADHSAAYQEALATLRSHTEDCEECINALRSGFPELQDKQFTMISLNPIREEV